MLSAVVKGDGCHRNGYVVGVTTVVEIHAQCLYAC